MNILSNEDSVLERDHVAQSMNQYDDLFAGARRTIGSLHEDRSISKRKQEYKTLVNNFYDLVTDFYQWGWGEVRRDHDAVLCQADPYIYPQSFHFAPRFRDETFAESLKRSEHYIGLRLNMGPTTKALDVGCGIGGPLRILHKFTDADITGVTLNEYQVKVGNKFCRKLGIDHKCRLVQGDFQYLDSKFEPESFDVAFAFEATCHSPDRVQCFKSVNHCLKTGGLFSGYDWVVLPEKGFDATNPDHMRIKEGIEVGNGLPTLATGDEVKKSLEDAGFEVLEIFDANDDAHSPHQIPWYSTLNGSISLSGFRMTRAGRMCTHAFISTLECVRIAPRGSARVSSLLNKTAVDLVEGGKKEIFTPSYFFLARKL